MLTLRQKRNIKSLGFVKSNGVLMLLFWFQSGYRLAAKDYEAKLAGKFVPYRSITSSTCHLPLFVLQQEGDPVRTSNRMQHFLQERISPG